MRACAYVWVYVNAWVYICVYMHAWVQTCVRTCKIKLCRLQYPFAHFSHFSFCSLRSQIIAHVGVPAIAEWVTTSV